MFINKTKVWERRRYPPRLRKQRFAGQMLEAMIRN